MSATRFHAFFTILTVAFASLSPVAAEPGNAVVTGKFLGDGKDGNIKHLVALTHEPFSDKPAIELVFTEKDPANSKQPGFEAGFRKLGNALVISVFKDGDIFGCEVAHSAHEKSPFSSLGRIQMKDFKVGETEVSGILTTAGELETFGQKWEVDLTFSAPLPKGAFEAEEKETPPAPEEPEGNSPGKPEADAAKIPVADLPLPATALDVEYKALVEQISFRAESPVSEVAAHFVAKLQEQGWKESPGSLIGNTNAIIKRVKGGADLTIMVQPAGKGCAVKVFARGFDWSENPTSGATKPASDSIEDEADRLLNDALKQIPGGF